jgi:hypothetical protein
MSQLATIARLVREKGSHTEPWTLLCNTVFRGDTGFADMKRWAASENLAITMEYLEQGLEYSVPRSVTFRPARQTT